MAQVLVNESSLEDIGDAIREKNESSDTYLPSEMGNAIRAIRTGGDVTSVNGKTGAVVLSASDVGAGTYSKPSGGIPKSDLASAVQASLGKADTAYSKPSGGIPKSDLASAVQASLGKADTALQTAPVTSVNGKTGAVNITPANIGAKVVQQAVSNPTAIGTSIEFVDTISQDTQGVISATRKTVKSATTEHSGLMSEIDKVDLNRATVTRNAIIKLREELSYPIAKGSVVLRNVSSVSVPDYRLYRAKRVISSDSDDVDASWESLSSNVYSSGYLSDIVNDIDITHDLIATDIRDLVYPLPPYSICKDLNNVYQLGPYEAVDASSAFWTIVPNLGYCVSENRRRIESVGDNASIARSMAQGLTDSLAPYYSSGLFPITAGQMVLYGSTNAKRLYRALVDIPTAEDFTAAHWEQVTVDELINVLEDGLSSAQSTLGVSKEVYVGLIQSDNTWSDNAARNFMIVPCEPNDIVEITANSAQTFYAFLKSFSYPITVSASPDYCSGYSGRIRLAADSSINVYAPPDCHYVYVMTNSGVDCTPEAIKINGYDLFGNVADQMGNIICDLSVPQWKDGYINTNVATGGSVNLNGVIAANYRYKILHCTSGDRIYLAGLGGGNARLWAFVNSSCKLLEKSDESASTAGTILTAPQNTAFCIVNASGDVEARAFNIDDPTFYGGNFIASFKNIGEMQELFTPESVYAFVASDRSDFCKGYRGNLFEYKKSATYEDIELDDGAYARLVTPPFAPLKSNYECIDRMLEIAYSYCGSKTEFPNGIPYVAMSGPFRNDGNLTGIQCSQFVNAVLQGLTYENSKLSGETTNTLLDGGCTWINTSPWASSNEGAMSANQLAHFAAAHGWLNQTNYFKDCEVGDVAFFAIDTPPYRAVNWNGIVHCAIVVAKHGNEVVCIGAGDILEPNESAPLLDASKQWYPNGTSAQAVTCQVIKDSTAAYWYNNRGLFGFGRFPVTYNVLSVIEQEIVGHL